MGWADTVAHPVLVAVPELAKVNDIIDAEEDGGDEGEGQDPDPEADHTHQQQWGLGPFVTLHPTFNLWFLKKKKMWKKFILKT